MAKKKTVARKKPTKPSRPRRSKKTAPINNTEPSVEAVEPTDEEEETPEEEEEAEEAPLDLESEGELSVSEDEFDDTLNEHEFRENDTEEEWEGLPVDEEDEEEEPSESVLPKMSKSRYPVWEDGVCDNCGYRDSGDDFYRLTCPTCGREGCFECMPAGRGCECPECEEQG